MSSSGSNYASPAISPEQVDAQAATVLNTIQRVRNLIDAEVDFVNRRITRSVSRQDAFVRSHVEFFERKSLSNITTSSAYCISELPSYQQRETQGREIASEPASPGHSESSSSQVSTEQIPVDNMDQGLSTSLERVTHPRRDDEFEGFETPQWDLFVQRAGVCLKTMETRLLNFNNALIDEENPPSTLDKKVMLNKVNKFIDEVEAFKNEFHTITMEEQVNPTKMEEINALLESKESDLIRLQIQVDIVETNPQTSPIDMDTHLANMVSAVQSVANSPVLPLPLFYGKVTTYAAFKKSFKCLIQKVAGPKMLWATHLANSMRGDAKKYIGDPTNWFDQYDKLWKSLDTKYDNKWSLSSETTKAVFHNPPPPSGDVEAIKTWFFEAMQALVTLLDSGMSLEQVGVNHIILQLPEEQRKELLNGLRALLPSQKTASFTMDMVRSVFNDTVGISTDEEATPLKGTLNLQAHTVEPNSKQNQVPQPQHQVSAYQINTLSPGFNSNGRAHNTATQQGKPMWCSLCQGQESITHYTFRCPNFLSPAEKRLRLWELGLCPNCARSKHLGQCSQHINLCSIHTGERHYTWLCDVGHQQHQYSQYQQQQAQSFHQPPAQHHPNLQQPPPQYHHNFQHPPPQYSQNFQQPSFQQQHLGNGSQA